MWFFWYYGIYEKGHLYFHNLKYDTVLVEILAFIAGSLSSLELCIAYNIYLAC